MEKSSKSGAEELNKQRHLELEATSGGLKRTQNEGTTAVQDSLRAQLSVPRKEKLGGRARLARWDEKKQVAEFIRKDSKFKNFAYSKQETSYLEYYEALYLLEVGRLQLEYNGSLVSVEQAYVLLLGEVASGKHEQYLVFSALYRTGYIVVKHQLPRIASGSVTREDCIWALLEAKVGNQPVPKHIKDSPHYALIEKRMEDFKALIVSQKADGSEVSEDFDTRKLKAAAESSTEPEKKKSKLCKTGQNLLDQLKTQPSYAKFEELFHKFGIVQLNGQDYTTEESVDSSLKISFDLHLHKKGFNKNSAKAPTFNVIILPPHSAFPIHAEISKIQSQQPYTVPLLVVSVSESKQIQAILYYIN